jgi:hypothetical protein
LNFTSQMESKSSTPSESFVRPSTASNLNESTRYHDRSHDLVHGVVKRPNDSGVKIF